MKGGLVVVKEAGLLCHPVPSKAMQLNEYRKDQCVSQTQETFFKGIYINIFPHYVKK